MGMVIPTDDFCVSDLDQFEGRNGRYELLDGALIVTPLGTSRHQAICLQLGAALLAYVGKEQLGAVFAPGRVVVDSRTALEPDIVVVPGPAQLASAAWESHPAPLLAVEVLSPSTRSFDQFQKRNAYLRRGCSEYWLVDGDQRAVTVVRPDQHDQVVTDLLRWSPAAAREPFTISVSALLDAPAR